MTNFFRVLVTGSRFWVNYKIVENAIKENVPVGCIPIIIHGEARGADDIARKVALRNCWPSLGVPADWARYGKSAGPIRNIFMLDEFKPHIVLGFFMPGSRGTIHCMTEARVKGIPVREYRDTGK